MYEIQKLDKSQIKICEDTISSNTFYMIVGSALITKSPLSVVRMGDGEKRLWEDVQSGSDPIAPDKRHDREWLTKLGVLGIPKDTLKKRLLSAARDCTYFAPSISGIWRTDYYNHGLSFRKRYVDNFFVNAWTEEMKIALFKQAGHVLFIHGNAETADAMQIRSQNKLGVKVSFLKLTSWVDTDKVIAQASRIKAPLVLFSAGPAGKYIGPAIANTSSKVVLDLGNAADHWTLNSLV